MNPLQAEARALYAARRIKGNDRSILARRVTVAEDVIERLDEDAKLIGRISGLLNRNTVDGFNEAADRINEVIRQWRELLGG